MKAEYILTIGVDKFYLTEKERDFYLESIDKGAKYVNLGEERLFGTSFQSLVHVNITKGMWRCNAGNWHSKDAKCFCNGEWKTLPDGTVTFVENKLTI